MYIVLVVQSGVSSGRQVCITRGKQVCVGRSSQSDFAFPRDAFISGTHFLLENDEGSCWITDLNSRNGTYVNGHKVERAQLNNGDTIMAGQTIFEVQLEAEDSSLSALEPTMIADSPDGEMQSTVGDASSPELAARVRDDRLLKLLREQFQPLYTVLDTSVDKKLLSSIYNTPHIESLSAAGAATTVGQSTVPLVRLPSDSPLLEFLVREGWGRKWGIYLTCIRDLQELSSHLHHLLTTPAADGAAEFRYYYPPVLRDYLGRCTSEEASRCFGPVEYFLVEAENPEELLQFTHTGSGVRTTVIPLTVSTQRPDRSFWHGNIENL
jgi:pSer/pThr/pTyr-binding forkhead associated (FHA) protein